jgi:hypothetical protein
LVNQFLHKLAILCPYRFKYRFQALTEYLIQLLKHKSKIKGWLKPYWSVYCEGSRTFKSLLVKPLQRLPISSEIIGPPKGIYESTQQWFATNCFSQNLHPSSYIEIYPSQFICRLAPRTIDKSIHWKFQIEYQRQLPVSFVAVLSNGRIWVNKGRMIDCSATITADDYILSDLSVEFRRLPQHHSIFGEWKLPPTHYLHGIAAVLTSAKADIYFHWLTDLLPRIELIRRSGIELNQIDWFIVNRYHYSFQKETLTALGIPADKIIESHRYRHIKSDQLLVPSLPGLPGNPPAWVCEFLKREFYKPQVVINSLKILERIYLTRCHARYRKVINEGEVMAFLHKLGFQCIVLESLTIIEKAILFSSAKVVVAPHGSGVTNTVFCQPGTKLIEFFSPNYVNVGYWAMANQLGLEYYYLLGEGKQPAEGIDPHLVGENILVNLETLSRLLIFAGVN